LLGILASWSVFGDPFQREPLIIGIIATLFFVGGMTTKDVVDEEADRRTGTKTLVNTYGAKKAAFISFPFLFFPFAVMPLLTDMGTISSYLLPLVMFMIPSCLVFWLMIKKSESKQLENVHAWVLMYVEYLFFAIVFSILIVLGETGHLSML
jgi:4-hydroxybenzoate polyprenyltransferase